MSRYAVFVRLKGKRRSVDSPCLDPLDFGRGNELARDELLRRGRVALFDSREDALKAIRATCKGQPFLREFEFVILECRQDEQDRD